MAVCTEMFKYILVTLATSASIKGTTKDPPRHILMEEYPYAVLLNFKYSKPSFCGASLITMQTIVTAGVCMMEFRKRKGQITAYLGNSVPRNATVVRKVVNYKLHPDFIEMKRRNDIAVGLLDRPVVFGVTVAKILLPGQYDFCEVGTIGQGVGWGRPRHQIAKLAWSQNTSDFGQTLMSSSLVSSAYRMIPRDECGKRIGFPVFGIATKCGVAVSGQFHRDDIGAGLVFTRKQYTYLGAVLSYIVGKVGVYIYVQNDWIYKAFQKMHMELCAQSEESD